MDGAKKIYPDLPELQVVETEEVIDDRTFVQLFLESKTVLSRYVHDHLLHLLVIPRLLKKAFVSITWKASRLALLTVEAWMLLGARLEK